MSTAVIDKEKVASLLTSLQTDGQALVNGDITTRLATIAHARALIAAIESPIESILRMSWAEPALLTTTRICIDIGLFDHLSKSKDIAVSVDDLAGVCAVQKSLLSRLLRHLASMQVIEEVSADHYKPTALSTALTIPKYRDGIPFCSEVSGPIFQQLPSFLAQKGYTDPEDNTAGPFQYAHQTPLISIEWRKERPRIQTVFNNHMAGYHNGRPSWMDAGFYPVRERLIHGYDAAHSDVFLVDVGGNTGHDLQELRQKQSDIPGTLILQDLPHIIESLTKTNKEGIEAVGHDFFTPQPVRGARAYFMHSVLHDWADKNCHRILTTLAQAMRRGYSKLLIYENVVPDQGASWQMTSLDIFMMVFVAARERKEAQWREMLSLAGLKVTGIWKSDPRFESLIEAELE